MEHDLLPGDLLFLTGFFHDYVLEKNLGLNLVLTNRLAKLEEIIDWDSNKGKAIKKYRELSGKWKDLPIEENKYIVSIFHHDLIGRKGQSGVVERCLPMFRYHPKTRKPFFEKVPDWIYKEIMKKCVTFEIRTDSQ
jgi:hypothetical protein